jgi:hypothetical protein
MPQDLELGLPARMSVSVRELENWVKRQNTFSNRDWLLFLYVPQGQFEHRRIAADEKGAFNQITTTLDEKTKTDTHPGIVTQATSAFQTGVHKVDDFLNDVSRPLFTLEAVS